ncbi:MAG: hypothetical protein H7Z13_00400 [Ferruginibacter sp.]|nr:hypothetical protein [Ferruginibacter sp.]
MRSNNAFLLKIVVLLVTISMVCTQSNAQLRQLRRKNIIDEKKALARRSEKNVVLVNTKVINDLMVKCIELGIENVQLVFTRIKAADVNDYTANHPEAVGQEKELIGKLTVLVKVEGNNISENNFVTDQTDDPNKSLINTMNSAGLVKLNKPYGNVPSSMNVLYFEVGSICPPPNSCN